MVIFTTIMAVVMTVRVPTYKFESQGTTALSVKGTPCLTPQLHEDYLPLIVVS